MWPGLVLHVVVVVDHADVAGIAQRSDELGRNIITTGVKGMSLDVLALSAATASLQIVRNAELLKGIPSAKAFVYTTEMVSVGEWARPLFDPVVLLPASTAVPGGTTGRSAALTKIIRGLAEHACRERSHRSRDPQLVRIRPCRQHAARHERAR